MIGSSDGSPLERRIVVGVDGSEDAKAALRWAAEEARERGGFLHAVIVWRVPPAALITPYASHDVRAASRDAAEATLAAALLAAADDLGGVRVSSEVIEGVPKVVLEALSETADLLVLGSRGHGTVSRIILGSVSKHMAVHAHCPVVVVPGQREPEHVLAAPGHPAG